MLTDIDIRIVLIYFDFIVLYLFYCSQDYMNGEIKTNISLPEVDHACTKEDDYDFTHHRNHETVRS